MGGATWEVLGLRPVKHVPENGMEGLCVSEGISTLLKEREEGLKGLQIVRSLSKYDGEKRDHKNDKFKLAKTTT